MGSHQILTSPSFAEFSPRQFPGLILWLKANALGLANNDPVASWTDYSGLGNHALQATAGKKPLFKTGVINGKAALRFDGSDDFMAVPSISKGNFTIFYVYKATTGGMVAEQSVNGSLNNGDYHYPPSGAHFAARGSSNLSAFDANPTSLLSDGTWRYISRAMDGTNAGHLAWINGVAVPKTDIGLNGTPGSLVVVDTYYIGARAGTSLFFAGDMTEIIAYDNVLSTTPRQTIEAYLAGEYAL